MENKDIRWLHRFENFKKALARLKEFAEKDDLNKLEQQGLVKAFEYTYELGWNTLKDYLEYQGETGIAGGRDAIRLAFRRGLIGNGERWMESLDDRNRTSRTYNQEIAEEIGGRILQFYLSLYVEMEETFDELKKSAVKK
jgi:nucleotidyltransferase substrate binding protein (TIGR01987 family)